jgi:hypothetical protein
MESPPPSTKDKLELLVLPTELLLYTFSYLDFPAVAAVRRCSSSLNQLVSSSSELLYRRIAWAAGFTEEAGVGASTAAGGRAVGGFGLHKLEEWWDEEELRKAVSAQRSMSGMYDGLKSWEDFGELPELSRCCRRVKRADQRSSPLRQLVAVSRSTRDGSRENSKSDGYSSETLLAPKDCFASSWTPSRIRFWPRGSQVRRTFRARAGCS